MDTNTHIVVDSSQLTVTHDPDQCLTQLAMTGRWSDSLRTRTSHVLRACLAEMPQALIIDLSQLGDPLGVSAQTWQTAARYTATQRPATQLIVCGAPARVRDRLRAAGSVETVDSMQAARAAAQHPPPTPYRRTSTLPRQQDAVSAGRTLAGDACLEWNLARLAYPARAIMSELLTNAVGHTDSDVVTAMVSIRGDVLHLAVQDGCRSLPRIIESTRYRAGESVEQRGAGLRLVAATARAWGALPCRIGKVVWATLQREGTA